MHEVKKTRAEINRENAQKSTGPRTPEGKARAARNATKHGLTARPLLSHEDEEAFETMQANILEDLEPETGREYDLAIDMATAAWNRRRAYRLQTAFLNARIAEISAAANAAGDEDNELDGDEAAVRLFTDAEEMQRLRLTLRYVTAAERAFKSTAAEFRETRQRREARQHEQDQAFEAELDTQLSAPAAIEPDAPGVSSILTDDEIKQAAEPHDDSPEAITRARANRAAILTRRPGFGFVSKNGYLLPIRLLAPHQEPEAA